MLDAIQYDLNKEVVTLWHKDKDISMLSTNDCIVLPGGFSYGDYLRCGAIARFSPMMQSVIEFANNGGKVLGVCNGFQILSLDVGTDIHSRGDNECAVEASACPNTFFEFQRKGQTLLRHNIDRDHGG